MDPDGHGVPDGRREAAWRYYADIGNTLRSFGDDMYACKTFQCLLESAREPSTMEFFGWLVTNTLRHRIITPARICILTLTACDLATEVVFTGALWRLIVNGKDEAFRLRPPMRRSPDGQPIDFDATETFCCLIARAAVILIGCKLAAEVFYRGKLWMLMVNGSLEFIGRKSVNWMANWGGWAGFHGNITVGVLAITHLKQCKRVVTYSVPLPCNKPLKNVQKVGAMMMWRGLGSMLISFFSCRFF